jgi:hypothetical protein
MACRCRASHINDLCEIAQRLRVRLKCGHEIEPLRRMHADQPVERHVGATLFDRSR